MRERLERFARATTRPDLLGRVGTNKIGFDSNAPECFVLESAGKTRRRARDFQGKHGRVERSLSNMRSAMFCVVEIYCQYSYPRRYRWWSKEDAAINNCKAGKVGGSGSRQNRGGGRWNHWSRRTAIICSLEPEQNKNKTK